MAWDKVPLLTNEKISADSLKLIRFLDVAAPPQTATLVGSTDWRIGQQVAALQGEVQLTHGGPWVAFGWIGRLDEVKKKNVVITFSAQGEVAEHEYRCPKKYVVPAPIDGMVAVEYSVGDLWVSEVENAEKGEKGGEGRIPSWKEEEITAFCEEFWKVDEDNDPVAREKLARG